MPYLISHLKIIITRYFPLVPIIELSKQVDTILDETYQLLEVAPKYVDFVALLSSENIDYPDKNKQEKKEAFIGFVEEKLTIRRLLRLAEMFERISDAQFRQIVHQPTPPIEERRRIFQHLGKIVEFFLENPHHIKPESENYVLLQEFKEEAKTPSLRILFITFISIMKIVHHNI